MTTLLSLHSFPTFHWNARGSRELSLHMWVLGLWEVIIAIARCTADLVREMRLLLRASVIVRLWGCIASHWGA